MNRAEILAGIPDGLRDALFNTYEQIGKNFVEHRWEPSELNGGKFCEVVYTVVAGYIAGKFPAKPAKPKNIVDSCKDLEAEPSDPGRAGDRSVRVLIPRVLPILYEIRN